MNRYLEQSESAAKAHEEWVTKVLALADKHNIKRIEVHDEVILEGDPENVAAFERELAELKK